MALTYSTIVPGSTLFPNAAKIVSDRLTVVGVAADFATADPVLKMAQIGLETDTGKLKFGDGVTNWVNLPYFASEVSDAAAVAALLQTLDAAAKRTFQVGMEGLALEDGAVHVEDAVLVGAVNDGEVKYLPVVVEPPAYEQAYTIQNAEILFDAALGTTWYSDAPVTGDITIRVECWDNIEHRDPVLFTVQCGTPAPNLIAPAPGTGVKFGTWGDLGTAEAGQPFHLVFWKLGSGSLILQAGGPGDEVIG